MSASFDAFVSSLVDSVKPLESLEIPLLEAMGCSVASDVVSMVDVPAVESEELVEALAEGVVRELGAVVPFAETTGAVAGRPERLRDRHLRVAHDFLVVGDTGDAGAQRVTPGE